MLIRRYEGRFLEALGEAETVTEVTAAVISEAGVVHRAGAGCVELGEDDARSDRVLQHRQRVPECRVQVALIGGRLDGKGAADVTVVAGDIDLHVEFERLPGFDGVRGVDADADIGQSLRLPEGREPVIGDDPLVDGDLVGAIESGLGHTGRDPGERAADADLGQFAGEAEVGDLVRVLERTEVVEDGGRIDQFHARQAVREALDRGGIDLEQSTPMRFGVGATARTTLATASKTASRSN